MNSMEQKEALESIRMIKELVTRTKEDLYHTGSDWICFIWGVFSIIGVAGQRTVIPHGPWIGAWWMGLTAVGIMASFIAMRSRSRPAVNQRGKTPFYWFLMFWAPMMLLAFTLAAFIGSLPEVSPQYIPVIVLLVISTGYITIGLMFFRAMLYLGIIGYLGCVLSGLFFLSCADLIMGLFFGLGLFALGLAIRMRRKKD